MRANGLVSIEPQSYFSLEIEVSSVNLVFFNSKSQDLSTYNPTAVWNSRHKWYPTFYNSTITIMKTAETVIMKQPVF